MRNLIARLRHWLDDRERERHRQWLIYRASNGEHYSESIRRAWNLPDWTA